MDGITLLVFLLAAVILILGFAGQMVFKRTNVPDVIWLVLFGILLSLFLTPAEKGMLITFAGPFGALALLTIMFDAGMGFNLIDFSKGIPRGVVLALLTAALATIATTLLTHYALGWPWLYGLMLGAALGGTSSGIIVPIITRLNVGDYLKSVLTIESTITDVLVIVFVIALINLIGAGTADPTIALKGIIAAFSVGIAVGAFGALAWLFMLQKIEHEINSYLFDFTIILLLYVFAEFIGGSGIIAGLTFAIALGNLNILRKVMLIPEGAGVTRGEKAFYAELDFFIRTFFFVYLGIIFNFSNFLLLGVGLILTLAYVATRVVSAQVSLAFSGVSQIEKWVASSMTARGLAAAVVSQTPLLLLSGKVPLAEESILQSFAPIVLGVIIFSIVATGIGVYFTGKALPPQEQKNGAAHKAAK